MRVASPAKQNKSLLLETDPWYMQWTSEVPTHFSEAHPNKYQTCTDTISATPQKLTRDRKSKTASNYDAKFYQEVNMAVIIKLPRKF